MVRLLLSALLAAGCVHAPPVAAPAPEAPRKASGESRPGPSGSDVEEILAGSGLAYVTLQENRRWMVAFAGNVLPRVVLYVVHGREFTLVMGKLFTVRTTAGVEIYRAIARTNYDLDQLKLSVDETGGVFASYEVPTRILDRQELLENIFGLAGAIDRVLPDLVRIAGPEGLEPPPDREEPPPPEPGGPILEVRRGGPAAFVR